MPSPLAEILTCLVAYFAGSIPFGLVTARMVAGIDIRKEGSGNIGATNVGRVLGARWGITVLILDALKGLLPVWLVPRLLTPADAAPDTLLPVLAGVATVVGHMFPCWLGFRGGKGVATSLGVVLMLGPLASLAALAGFALGMLSTRIVSLSSMLAAGLFAVAQLALLRPVPFHGPSCPLAVFSLAVPALIIIQHRANVRRLLNGTEKKFSFGSKKSSDGESPPQSPPDRAAEPPS